MHLKTEHKIFAKFIQRRTTGSGTLDFPGQAAQGAGEGERTSLQGGLGSNPGQLILKEAAKCRTLWGRGIRTLTFGRTDPRHEGLRHLKLSWGPRETRLQHFRFDVRSKIWQTRRKARFAPWEGVISKMTIPVLRLVGTIAYRHVG